LINIIDTINRCNKYKIPAFLLALDQAKAFDSVRHDYMKKCFEFFGFPANFIRMIEVFTTKRTAHIILEGGRVSDNFDLDIGNAQGNGPSPLQFNICEQILFFKIELDPSIRSVFEPAIEIPVCIHSVPVPAFDENRRGEIAYENNRCTNKLEGYADDGTVIAKVTNDVFPRIRQILEQFENLSGLSCNIEKSMVLPVGYENDEIPVQILESGFKVVKKVNILGAEITNNADDLVQNFEKVIRKVSGIKNYWIRYRLSLAGRITVAKTFMLSQIGYLGAILNPTQQQIQLLSEEIDSFIKGGLNIAKQRITGDVDAGGLGMIDVQSYITSLQAAWFKKINGNISDNWRFDINKAASGNIFAIDPGELKKTGLVIATGIAESFCKVRLEFCKTENNLLESFAVNNPVLKRFENNVSLLTILKNNVPRINVERIFHLKISDFWDGSLKSLDEICEDTGINFSLVTYMRLNGIISQGCARFRPDRDPDPRP
jgi:hypothetical protein